WQILAACHWVPPSSRNLSRDRSPECGRGSMKAGAFLVFLGRRALFMAQDGICPICGETLPQRDDYRLCTVDHVWPKSIVAARDKTRGNTLLAHKACNAGKANRRPTGC